MIYLASKSPRRRQLLDQIGLAYEVLEVEIAEQWDEVESAQDYVQRLALAKALAGVAMVDKLLPVLGADTEVVIDDVILGKPANKADAVAMLQTLSGRTHYVYSAVALIDAGEQVLLNTNRVRFKSLTIGECEAYCETGEPYGKAGAYGIQGRAAAFISRLEGSYSGVMGLPLLETAVLLKNPMATKNASCMARFFHETSPAESTTQSMAQSAMPRY